MGKVSDVLIEIDELKDWNEDLECENQALKKRIEHLEAENARLSIVARKEMMSASKMRNVCYNALQAMDAQLSVAFHEIDDAVVRDH